MAPLSFLLRVLRGNAPVVWSWLATVALTWFVQVGEGLGAPSEGLALSVAALPAAVVALAAPRVRPWVMAAVVSALGAVALADAAYHRFFGMYPPLSALLGVEQGWRMRSYVVELLAWRDLAILALVAATVAWAFRVGKPPSPDLGRRWRTGLPLAVSLVGSLPALGWAWLISPGSADMETGGFLYAHLVDARRVVAEWHHGGGATPSDLSRVQGFLAGRSGELPGESPGGDGADAPWWGVAAGSNVVVVQVEALNQWLVDTDVGGEPVMPFLRSLASRGLFFTHVFDETHEGRSSDADYLVMASQHPLRRDAVSMVRPDLDPVALPDLLREDGYTTFSAHAHIPGFWNAARRHARYGFQESLFEAELGPGPTLGFGLTDSVFFQRTVPHVADLPHPFLAWFITLTMHGPHPDLPPSFRGLALEDLEGTSLGNYLLKARHTDDALRVFVDSLTARGAMERTTLVLYGDHTEKHRFDMAWVRANAGVPEAPGDAQALLLDRVPLIVVPPGGTEGARIGTVGGLLDVAPTLLHVLGRSAPRWFLGESLLTPSSPLVAQASGEVVTRDLMWTGRGCYTFPEASPVETRVCDPIRARAREELEVSWLITRHGLAGRAVDGTVP